MIKIGITGNLGSGKTKLLETIKNKGYKVINCDKEVDEIYKDIGVQNEIKQILGIDITQVSKKDLYKQIFKTSHSKYMIERIINKEILKIYKKTIKENKYEKIIFIEVPTMIEKNLNHWVDKIIVTKIKEEKRYKLLSKYRNMDRKKFDLIDKNQLNVNIKELMADYIFDMEIVEEKVSKNIDKIVKELI